MDQIDEAGSEADFEDEDEDEGEGAIEDHGDD